MLILNRASPSNWVSFERAEICFPATRAEPMHFHYPFFMRASAGAPLIAVHAPSLPAGLDEA